MVLGKTLTALVRVLCEPELQYEWGCGISQIDIPVLGVEQGARDLVTARRLFTTIRSVMESKDISGLYRYVPNFINEEEEAYLLRKVDPSTILRSLQDGTDPIRRRLPKVLNPNGEM